jgi:hypothetical protein
MIFSQASRDAGGHQAVAIAAADPGLMPVERLGVTVAALDADEAPQAPSRTTVAATRAGSCHAVRLPTKQSYKAARYVRASLWTRPLA